MNYGVKFYTLLLCIATAILLSRSFTTTMGIVFGLVALMTWFDEVCRAIRGR